MSTPPDDGRPPDAGQPPSTPPQPGWNPVPGPTQLPSGWTPPPPSGWTPPPPSGGTTPPVPTGWAPLTPQQPSSWTPTQPGWNPAQPYGYGPAGWPQQEKRDSRLPIIVILLLVGALIVAIVVAVMMLGSTFGTLSGGSSLRNVAVGQCFNGGRATDTSSSTILRTVEIVDCAQPHGSEMAASFDYPGVPVDGSYPGEDRMSSFAESECTRMFEGYVGLPFSESIYGMTYAYPLEVNWLLTDRSIQCIAHPPDGQETMTGTVRNSRR